MNEGQIIGTADRDMAIVENQYRLLTTPRAGQTSVRRGIFSFLKGKIASKSSDSTAATHRAELEADRSIEGRFAAEVGRRFAGLPMHEVSRALPGIWRAEGLPKDRDAAFVAIAGEARKLADKHMAGPALGLPPEYSREAKAQALMTALYTNSNEAPMSGRANRINNLEHDMARLNRTSADVIRKSLPPQIAPTSMRPDPQQAKEVAIGPHHSLGNVAAAHSAGNGMTY